MDKPKRHSATKARLREHDEGDILTPERGHSKEEAEERDVSIEKQLRNLLEAIEAVRRGDLTKRLRRHRYDIFGEIADSYRVKAHKNPVATITLQARRVKELVYIEVSDDGAGLDLRKIEAEALKQNIIPLAASADEIKSSVFKGISTTKQVSAISGRGLGLAIVKQKIESIGGSIHVETSLGKGTTFQIQIPMSLAVIKVLFVTVSDQIYAIPINYIERLLTVTGNDIQGLLNYNAIVFENEEIPVTHLSSLFSVEPKKMHMHPVVIIRRDHEKLGIVVDNLLSTQEVVIKPLARVVKENKYFSGSALIGSGEMVLILDVDHLFLSRRQKNEWKTADSL